MLTKQNYFVNYNDIMNMNVDMFINKYLIDGQFIKGNRTLYLIFLKYIGRQLKNKMIFESENEDRLNGNSLLINHIRRYEYNKFSVIISDKNDMKTLINNDERELKRLYWKYARFVKYHGFFYYFLHFWILVFL